jgi:hypothetical protein
MKESPTKPGWYYIYNAAEDQKDWRLAKWSAGNTDTGVYEGDYYDDQLWSFTNVTMTNTTMGEYYQINNFLYPQCFMSKWGEEDSDWGTVTGADVDNQQLWALVPRYEATVQDRIIFQADNRNGTLDFTETVTITTGLQLTTKNTISTTVGLSESLTDSIPGIYKCSMQLKAQVDQSLSKGEQADWSITTQMNFTAPAGFMYRVVQRMVPFKSRLIADNMNLYSDYYIQQSAEKLGPVNPPPLK